MLEQAVIDKIISDTYMVEIFKASKNNQKISMLTVDLIKTIKEIYRFFEPTHYTGELVICLSLDSSIMHIKEPKKIQYNKNILITLKSKKILIQKNNDELLLWENVDIKSIIKEENILFYCFTRKSKNIISECFIINNTKIKLNPIPECASIYSLYYPYLNEALNHYSLEKIYNSSCEHFRTSWADEKRIYFKNGPEEIMRKSLKEHLSSTLRGVEISPEYPLNASKAVDVRVHWGTANRSALIEIKWLGVSLNEGKNKKSTEYTNSRAVEGAKQLKEYLDLIARDTPSTIIKGYLVVIDGRRKGISQKIISIISEKEGFHYQSTELSFPENYNEIVHNFEPPIRMFASPVCQ